MDIAFVTSNAHKVVEAGEVLSRLWDICGMSIGAAPFAELVQRHVPYPEIQAATLEEVARFGVLWLLNNPEGLVAEGADSPGPFILEDSGLFVDSLGGFPGVYSSYVFRTLGYEGILRLLEGRVRPEDRSATFVSVIGLHLPGKGPKLFRGDCRGTISTEGRGRGGFGYDPIFIPWDHKETFGEMQSEQKGTVSHRGRAFEDLGRYLAGLCSPGRANG